MQQMLDASMADRGLLVVVVFGWESMSDLLGR
jgi:hypothetical protein